jgi:hypothetical protein
VLSNVITILMSLRIAIGWFFLLAAAVVIGLRR